MLTPPLEIEAKFALDDPAAAESLAGAATLGDGIALGDAREQVDHDDYADTLDLALLRAGWALRHRTRFVAGADGWPSVVHLVTLKQLASAARAAAGDGPAGVQARIEHEGPVVGAPFDPLGWPPAVRAAAEAAVGGPLPALHELFTLAQQRRVRPVALDGAAVGELSIDAVRVHLAGGARRGADAVARFDEVEFELAAGAPPHAVRRLAEALAAIEGARPADGGKVDRAIALLAASDALGALSDDARARLAAALAVLGDRSGDAG